MAMTFRYPNLVKLGNDQLTDESRQPIQEDRDERSTMIELASGKKKKFVKGVWRSWDISWDNVAANSDLTVDGFGGRDEIRSLAEGAGLLTLVLSDGINPAETYNVYIDSYDEELLSRRGSEFRYRVNLSLSEQGG